MMPTGLSVTMQNLAAKRKYMENYDFQSNIYSKVAKNGQDTSNEVLKAQDNKSSTMMPKMGPSVTMQNLAAKAEYLENYDFQNCDESSKYEKMSKIGQGTFGEVFKAREKKSTTKKFVAMKRVLMNNQKEGFPITAMREIRILQQLKHENVINLIEICRTKATTNNRHRSSLYLVFDFCEHDLAGLLSNTNVKFSLGEIKRVMQQLLNGLFYCHNNRFLHRDIKPANVLITKNGVLKIADFGLARPFSASMIDKPNSFTNRVVTLWYRPPELLLGDRDYGPPVDMWGAGCIMAEMWTRSPILRGNTEKHQIDFISQLCGSFTPDVWPGVEKLDLYNKVELPMGHKRKVKERLKAYVRDHHGCDLLDQLLQLDPSGRLNADTALDHDFFWTDPMPADLSKMLSTHTQSMFEYLVPKRRPSQQQNTSQNRSNDSGYQERVY